MLYKANPEVASSEVTSVIALEILRTRLGSCIQHNYMHLINLALNFPYSFHIGTWYQTSSNMLAFFL